MDLYWPGMLRNAELQAQVPLRVQAVQAVPAETAHVALQQMQAAAAMFPQLGAVMLPQLSALGLLPGASSGLAAHLAVPCAAAQSFPEQMPLAATRPLQTPLANPITSLFLPGHAALMPGTAGEREVSAYSRCSTGLMLPRISCIMSTNLDNDTSGPMPPGAEVWWLCLASPQQTAGGRNGITQDLDVSLCRLQSAMSLLGQTWLTGCCRLLAWWTTSACLLSGASLVGSPPSTNSILSTTLGKLLQGRANRSLPIGVLVNAS